MPAGHIAEQFAGLGYDALALYYFGGEDLPKLRAQVPMEFVDNAISYLKKYDNGRIKKISTYGISLGSILALMSGVIFKEITCVIAVSPAHVVTEGFLSRVKMTGNSFLTYQGKDIPYLPLPSDMKMYEIFQSAYKDTARGNIPVEQIQGRILFIASQMDESWPAAYSTKMMESRLVKNQFLYPHKSLVFEKSGHLVGIVPDTKKHRLIPLILLTFRQERRHPKECRMAREKAESEIVRWLEEW
ncbi:MAG TPA: acyl-CoA thioester hydrolase/BAAT C-terminal domain-containing protein [Clostridia bacterium]|nr:acyl-CoA thioester hydrolase/BAAT C-terminal domain-containing protein [Clostridia bacterium]